MDPKESQRVSGAFLGYFKGFHNGYKRCSRPFPEMFQGFSKVFQGVSGESKGFSTVFQGAFSRCFNVFNL